jgi:PIN domain-containing protein
VKFFFDNNLPPKLAKSLHLLVEPDHEVVHLKDRFSADAPDEEWITALAKQKDWIIVSGDLRIRRNPHVGGVEVCWTYGFLSQTGLDQPTVLDPDVEICEMPP